MDKRKNWSNKGGGAKTAEVNFACMYMGIYFGVNLMQLGTTIRADSQFDALVELFLFKFTSNLVRKKPCSLAKSSRGKCTFCLGGSDNKPAMARP